MIKLGKTPVDQTQLTALMVNHHVMRFNIPVHDTIAMAELEGLKQFEDIIADIKVAQSWVQNLQKQHNNSAESDTKTRENTHSYYAFY